MNLENTTIIVANLGELKAYQVTKHEAIGDHDIKVSYSLQPLTDMDYGEEHNVQIEKEKRTLEDVAHNIDRIVDEKKPQHLFLAFPGQLNGQLLDKLNKNTQTLLAKNVPSDLVKTAKNKILSHFVA